MEDMIQTQNMVVGYQKITNEASDVYKRQTLTRLCTTGTNHIYQIGIIRFNMTHIPKPMTIIFKIIFTLHRVHGDSPPSSQISNHLVHNFHNIHSPILRHILLFLSHQLKTNLIWKGVWKPRLSPNNKFKFCSIHNPSQIKLHAHLFKKKFDFTEYGRYDSDSKYGCRLSKNY